MVRFGSPDLRTGALGVKRVRGSVSPYSRGRAGSKKAHFGQTSKFDPRSIFRGDLFLGRSIFRERCVVHGWFDLQSHARKDAGGGEGHGNERRAILPVVQEQVLTHLSLKIDLPKNRSPQKVDRGSNFEFWPKWAFFGPARPRE